MPPVAAAIGAIAGAVGSVGAAIGATAAGFGIAPFVISAFKQIALGLTLSAISRAFTPKPDVDGGGSGGTKLRIAIGEQQPQSMIFGTYATAGDLVYVGSWGEVADTHNAIYVQVIELGDWPASLDRVWINGEYVTLGSTPNAQGFGYPVTSYNQDGKDYLWVKFYDGSQTTADPYLVDKLGDGEERLWTTSMIGRGIPYAIVSARLNSELHSGKPECRFQLSAKHYDRRKDSTAGGSGGQRWNDQSTWTATRNPVVMIENILRGIHDPITGDFVWGGQGITSADLPASVWFAAMNECDETVPRAAGGTELRYTAGLEVRVNEEPAAIIEELLKACQGIIAEVAGTWTIRAGAPSSPIYAFTDEDLIVTSPDTYDPFPGLDEVYNEVQAVYPAPDQGWAAKDAPARAIASYLEEDGGKRNVANLEFPAVFSGSQVQRLMLSALKDGRRFRRHMIVLPPEAQALGPLDEISWTSTQYGYVNKAFSIDMVEDLPNGCVALAIQERDPTDYDWDVENELPSPVGYQPRPIREPEYATDFSVSPDSIKDEASNARRPAIRLDWTVRTGVTEIRYRVRLVSAADEVQENASAAPPEAQGGVFLLTLNGDPLTLGGDTLGYTVFADASAGTLLIHPVLPDQDYEVSAIYEPRIGRRWSAWMPVHTLNILLEEQDFSEAVRDKIQDAADAADAAAANALAALTAANEATALVEGLSAETLADLQEIVDQLEGIDTGAIQEIRGIALAGTIQGWAADPTFQEWTADVPDHWTVTTSAVTKSTDSEAYPNSLLFTVPATASSFSVTGSSWVTGQLPGADIDAQYVVVGFRGKITSGSTAGLRIAASWRTTGTGVFVRGDAFGVTAAQGNSTQWGLAVSSTRTQSYETIWKKPTGLSADGVRVLIERVSSSATAVTVLVEVLDIRAASEAEVKAHLANGYADAAIDVLELAITGPGGALAALQTTIEADYGAADAAITSSIVAVSNDVEALAGTVEVIEAQFGGDNIVKNPVFSDGPRAVGGGSPAYWTSWDVDGHAVIQRGSTGSATVINMPTKYAGFVLGDGAAHSTTAIDPPAPVKPGDIVAHSIKVAATGTSPNFQLGNYLRWYDAEGAFLSSAPFTPITLTNSTTWSSGAWEDQAPAGAASFDLVVRRDATGTLNNGLFTNVEARIVDKVAYAAANTAAAAAATANSSIATINTTVEASFDDFSAFVDAGLTAVALEDQAASAYVIRATAGAGSAGLRVVAWDDEDGSGGAVVFDADNVIAPGTLSTGMLVVTDLGHNMVPDDQLQSSKSWSLGTGFSLIKSTTNSNASSVGEIRYTYSSGHSLPLSAVSAPFPVRSGQRLRWAYEHQRLGGTVMTVRVQLQWLDKSGAVVSSTAVNDNTSSSTARLERSGQITVPADVGQARFLFIVMPGTDSSVRFYAPSIISNEDASVLVTPDSIFVENLQVFNAWIESAMIADAAVGTLKIANFAVTDDVDKVQNTDQTGTGYANTITYDSLVVNIPNNGTRVTALAMIDFDSVVDGSWEITITQNSSGSDVVMGGATVTGIHHQCTTAVMGFSNIATAGNVTFKIRWRADNTIRITRSSMIIMQRKR